MINDRAQMSFRIFVHFLWYFSYVGDLLTCRRKYLFTFVRILRIPVNYREQLGRMKFLRQCRRRGISEKAIKQEWFGIEVCLVNILGLVIFFQRNLDRDSRTKWVELARTIGTRALILLLIKFLRWGWKGWKVGRLEGWKGGQTLWQFLRSL